MLKAVQIVKRLNLLIHQQQSFNVVQDVKKFGIAVERVKVLTGKRIKQNAFKHRRKLQKSKLRSQAQ